MPSKSAIITVIPPEWRRIVEVKKSILGWPSWSDVAALPTGKNVKTRTGQLHTVAAEETRVLFQLADEYGTGLEGARLRLTAWAYQRQRDVTATLEVVGGRSFVTISRVDAWPTAPHRNSLKAMKRSASALADEIITCHAHRFDANAQYGPEAFGPGPEGNLPVAEAFPKGLQSFREFLRCVGTEFNIVGLDDFDSPPSWQGLV